MPHEDEYDIERFPLIDRKTPSINSEDLKRPLIQTIRDSLDRTPSIEMPPEKVNLKKLIK